MSDPQPESDEVQQDSTIGSVDLTRWPTPPGKALVGTAAKASQRVGDRGALILILTVGGVIAVALSFIASRIYDSVTESDGVAGLDKPILDLMISWRSPALDSVVTAYTNVAGPIGMPILAVAAILILSLWRRSFTPAILIAAAGIGSLLMTVAGKDIIGRDRPPLVDAVPPYDYTASFPSGHTLNAVVIAGVVAYLLLLRRMTTRGRVITIVVAALFALTIGVSRVFLGHHWFTDVLAAWVLGAAWLALVITAHRLYITVRVAREEARSPERVAAASGRPGDATMDPMDRMDPDQPPPRDETKVTEQPSLTFSTGRIWLVVGGLFTAIALAVLIAQAVLDLPPRGVPIAAAIIDLVLYAGMIVARIVVPVTRLRLRLSLMAIGMLAIAAVSLAAVLIVAFTAASAAP